MKTKLLNRLATWRVASVRNLLEPPQSLGRTATRALKSVILCGALLLAATHPLRAEVTLVTTITNPAPGFYADYFGWSVAMLDSTRIIIGAPQDSTVAYNAGAAYLFSTNGTLLATFTNSAGAEADGFGWAVAGLGDDRVLIGSPSDNTGVTNAGAAYLFNADGTSLTSFTNPTPAAYDNFGGAVASIGTDRVIISAYSDDRGAVDTGVVYLFNTNGALLTTITNPTPATYEDFGYSLAAVGTDRLLIGARADNKGGVGAGAVYLFSTDGTLLTTITNPTPVSYDYFGTSVAVLGRDRLLIGAPSDNTGTADAGAAYLYATNGTLLTTLTNPAPAYLDSFGISVAAVGTDHVLIGAHRDDFGASEAGIAYLFSTNGTLLTTITNPAPEANDWFGYSVAAEGDLLLIGAGWDSTGTASAGAAHLYSLQVVSGVPSLFIVRTVTNTVAVSWPSPSTGWHLQENTNSVSSLNWSNVTSGIQDDGTNCTHIVAPPTGNRFYRLHKP